MNERVPYTVVLQTERLFLRSFMVGDVDLLVELDSDPEVMRYISKGQPTPREQIEQEVLPRWLAYYERSEPYGFWAAHEKASGAFIGWFHLRPDRYEPEALELGYRLRRACWGRSYATEGGRALIAKAFREWRAERTVARALVGNKASRRVMEKCGLRFEESFVYEAALLPGWTEAERQAVKYGIHGFAYEAPGERQNSTL